MSPVIEQVRIQSFGPIKDATLELSPFHALIGPNDSGKSMTLRAIEAIVGSFVGSGHPLLAQQKANWPWSLRLAGESDEFSSAANKVMQGIRARGKISARARTLRLDPDAMREAHPLLVDGTPFDFVNERGAGLGRLVDGLLARSLADREKLEAQVLAMFPTVGGFRLFTTSSGRAIGVRLKDGTEVRPEHMSEGMLYFLAFSLLPYIEKPSMLLIEEPENGLHPARIKEVVRILREVSKTTQILMATHSPLIINELEAHEVTLVTRTEAEGTKFTRMDKTPHFAERASAWNLGELWIALSDGVSEEALLNPKRKP
ncbi:MAG: AAA family ATPase [Myxococcales bacterium]|nr:AAA family ATPase [Myxococcales bacterium]